MMKTRLKIKPRDQWLGLDLYEELPISVVISQDDITDIGGGSYEYSKQFTIPGTKANNEVFEGAYSVVGVDFNPLTKVECVVENGGNIIFEGFLRLNAVIHTGDYIEYEVYILTAISDFSSEIQALQLSDLDYQDLNHDNNYDNITTSWSYDLSSGGLFDGQILYPFYNYGLIYDTNNNPSFTFGLSGSSAFTGATNSVPEEYFKPAIQLKSLVDRLFSATTYSYESDFFNSDYFKSIYMSLADNGEIGPAREDEETENRNKFKVYAGGNLSYVYDPNDKRKPLVFSTLDPDGYDPLGSFTLDNDYPGSSSDDYLNYFNVPTTGDYYFNLRFRYFNQTGINYPAYFRVKAYKSTSPFNIDNTGTLFYQTPGSGYAAQGTSQEANVFFSGALTSDEYVSLYVEFIDTAGFPDAGLRIVGPNGQGNAWWDLYTAPPLLGTTNVNMRLQMPDLSASDFFDSLIKMFNLTIEKNDVDKVLRIEPWNVYYNDSGRTQSDWTQKIDKSSSIRVEPLDFTLSKEVKWSYSSAGDQVLGKYYEDNYNNIFGSRTFTSSSNILTGEQELDLPYSPFPTGTIDGSDYVIMGRTYQRDDNNLQQPYAHDPNIFFWVGNRYMYENENGTGESSWYLSSGGTNVEWTTYPCVSHLSRLEDVQSTDISDLNFKVNWDFFQSDNNVINPWSSYSLYTSFWEEYINSLYSTEARRLQGRFYLEPKDIGEIKLNDKIFVKDNFWRIEKIEDANLVNPEMVEVSLIKELGGFYDKQPPAPQYDVNPNQSYPTPPTSTLYWYFEELLGAYDVNIQFPNLFIRQVSTGVPLLNTNLINSSGSVAFYPGDIQIIAGFNYRNLAGSLNNLQITFGPISGDDSYGVLQIPQPSDNTYYELDITRYFPTSGNVYATISTY